MIVDAYVESATGLGDLAGGVDVAAARGRIARRMVVNENERGRADVERVAHDLARVDRSLVHRPFRDGFGKQPILRIEEQNSKPFHRAISHIRAQIVDELLGRGQNRAAESARLEASKHHRAHRAEQIHWPVIPADGAGLRGGMGGESAGKRPEFSDQPLGPN